MQFHELALHNRFTRVPVVINSIGTYMNVETDSTSGVPRRQMLDIPHPRPVNSAKIPILRPGLLHPRKCFQHPRCQPLWKAAVILDVSLVCIVPCTGSLTSSRNMSRAAQTCAVTMPNISVLSNLSPQTPPSHRPIPLSPLHHCVVKHLLAPCENLTPTLRLTARTFSSRPR